MATTESAGQPEEPPVQSVEFRLYGGANGGGDRHELVEEFLGRWLYFELPGTIAYNPANEPPGLNTMSALAAAAATWTNVPGHYFRFMPPTTTSVQQSFHPDTGCPSDEAIDGINTVQWSTGWGESETLLAVTCLWGGTLAGDGKFRITEFDIWVRSDGPWSTTGAFDAFDLPTVLLHELGHAIGLGHDPDASTVMFAFLDLGEQKRTPTAEDAAGVLHLYADSLRRVIPGIARQ
jgi:hypothetical protein